MTKATNFRVAHAHNNQPLKNEVPVNKVKRFHHRSIVPGRIQVQPDLDESVIDIEELNPGDQHRVLIEGTTTMPKASLQRRLLPPLFQYLEADKDNIPPANIENHSTHEVVDSVTPSNEINVPDSVATEVRPSQKEKVYEVNHIIHYMCNKDGHKEYLVDWKGCPATERTHEPYDNLNECLKKYVDENDIPLLQQGKQNRNLKKKNRHEVHNKRG